jgi:uncharacterized repeat protein (TIGR03833 family)
MKASFMLAQGDDYESVNVQAHKLVLLNEYNTCYVSVCSEVLIFIVPYFCFIYQNFNSYSLKMDPTKRVNIKPGLLVYIVIKKDQRTGTLTEGVVKDILTNSPLHPHGIKVRLEDGQVGRVKQIKT